MYSVALSLALTTGGGAPQQYPHGMLGGGIGGWAAPGGYVEGPSTSFGLAGGYTNCWGGCSGFYANVGFLSYRAVPTPPEERKDGAEKKEGRAPAAARARVVVELPADASLYINDQPTRQTDTVRVFRTPELEAGETYFYVLRAEVMRDGQKIIQEKRVLVRPGEETRASFGEMADVAVRRR
jgi:uncharacterized protein (TIGR03000 family)